MMLIHKSGWNGIPWNNQFSEKAILESSLRLLEQKWARLDEKEFTLQVNFTTKPWISRPKCEVSERQQWGWGPNLGISHRLDLTVLHTIVDLKHGDNQ